MDEPKRGDGLDCTCAAWAYFECACGADWTPREVYELRAERDEYKRVAEILDDKQGELRAEVRSKDAALTLCDKRILSLEDEVAKLKEEAKRSVQHHLLECFEKSVNEIKKLMEDKRVLVEALKSLDEAFAPLGGSDTAKQALKKVEAQ